MLVMCDTYVYRQVWLGIQMSEVDNRYFCHLLINLFVCLFVEAWSLAEPGVHPFGKNGWPEGLGILFLPTLLTSALRVRITNMQGAMDTNTIQVLGITTQILMTRTLPAVAFPPRKEQFEIQCLQATVININKLYSFFWENMKFTKTTSGCQTEYTIYMGRIAQ